MLDLIQLMLKSKVEKRIKLEKILEHSFMTKNPVPSNLPDHYTQVTPSIRFIKKYLPNVELANRKNRYAVLPEVVKVVVIDDEHKVLKKREALHLKDNLIS